MNRWGRILGLILPLVALFATLGVADAGVAKTPHLATGKDFTVTLRSDGTIWAFGNNNLGQLGDGTIQQRNTPVQAGLPGNGTDWTAIAAGADHTVALKADGTLWAWGANYFGQLGRGIIGFPLVSSPSPVQVGVARDWVAVAAGAYSSVALKSDGSLWAWGRNNSGQLGNNDISGATQSSPVAVLNPGASVYVAVSITNQHVLALQADGTLWRWGSNLFGQLGMNEVNSVPHATPVQFVTGDPLIDNAWIAVSAGGWHSVAQQSDGTLWSWGSNSVGQLGNGSGTAISPAPARMGSDADWAGFSAGEFHTKAFKRNGSLWSWGANNAGQLGIGGVTDPLPHNLPVQITSPTGISSITAVAAGFGQSLSARADGSLFAWGDNSRGQLGTGTTAPSTIPVLTTRDASGWVGGEPGGQHTLARRTDGTLWAWGDNSSGQTGNDPMISSFLFPVQVGTASIWSILSGGLMHTAAIQADGTLWTWGSNGFGQLGDGTNDERSAPQQITATLPVSPANQWFVVSVGDAHTLALQADGTLWAWGANNAGQLGDNTTEAQTVPKRIVTGNPGNFDNNWKAVSAGGLYSVGLQADGTMWAWGDNSFGQFGIDPLTVPASAEPVQVINLVGVADNPGFNSSWTAIAAGYNHLLALQANGTAWGLGANSAGQLGNGSNAVSQHAFFPVQNIGFPVVPYVAIAAGDSHSVALKADGSIWSMGNNTSGQLGIGSTDPDIFNPVVHAVPVRENSTANDWVTISAGGRHSVALKADGSLVSWGENAFGQLGDGTTNLHNSPIPPDTVAPVLTITAGPVFFTNASTLTIGGYVESGAQVTVSVNTTASAGAVTISGPGGNAWSSTISNLVLGVNTITVTASDASANQTVRTATITYDANPFVKRLSDTLTGSAIQPLYDTVALSDTIQLRSVTITENPVFDRAGVTLNLYGGYDVGFAAAVGVTVIKGTLTVRQGTLRVKNLVIK